MNFRDDPVKPCMYCGRPTQTDLCDHCSFFMEESNAQSTKMERNVLSEENKKLKEENKALKAKMRKNAKKRKPAKSR